MCRLSSKRTGIGQCSSTTVTEKPATRDSSLIPPALALFKQLRVLAQNIPIVSNEFYVMSLMALLNAVHAYGIAVRGVTGVTSEGKHHVKHKSKRGELE